MKKYLSFVLALVLVLTSIAFTASADEIKDRAPMKRLTVKWRPGATIILRRLSI